MSAPPSSIGPEFSAFVALLKRVPSVEQDDMGAECEASGRWRVGFHIDARHPLAEVVEGRLGWELNIEAREARRPSLVHAA